MIYHSKTLKTTNAVARLQTKTGFFIMAHNIHFNEQKSKHSFFSVQQKAWHGLGQIVQYYPTSAEALQFAGLDFEVCKAPDIHRLPDGKEITSEKSFFTYREDNGTILGDIGSAQIILSCKTVMPSRFSIVSWEVMASCTKRQEHYFRNVRSFKDKEAKFKSIMGGTGQSRAQKAFYLCQAFAKQGALGLHQINRQMPKREQPNISVRLLCVCADFFSFSERKEAKEISIRK